MPSAHFLIIAFCCAHAHAGWQEALPGWRYEFPRDHGSHPAFKTEWWYFTGNLVATDGREFGYQLTFFRQGVIPPGELPDGRSRFIVSSIAFAHFAISDLDAGKFHFHERLSRGAFGEAGFDSGDCIAWIGGWTLRRLPGGNAFELKSLDSGLSIDLVARSEKPPVFHGENGVSRKGEEEGRASHYYSLSRMATQGSMQVGGRSLHVSGQSWFDHEWATSQLASGQAGWDWLSIQFDDGADLMLFQIRGDGGQRDPHSSGTFISGDGAATRIKNAEFTLEPGELWKSPSTKGIYPIRWRITIPKLRIEADVIARMKNQELVLSPVSYWEGAIRVEGKRSGQAIKGRGYLEMTGYAGRITGIQAPPPAGQKLK